MPINKIHAPSVITSKMAIGHLMKIKSKMDEMTLGMQELQQRKAVLSQQEAEQNKIDKDQKSEKEQMFKEKQQKDSLINAALTQK